MPAAVPGGLHFPARTVSTLRYHRQAGEHWCVAPGSRVTAGALIGTGRVRQHAAGTGEVVRCDTDVLEIEATHTDPEPAFPPLPQHASRPEMLQRIEEAGIVGLGGGGYPAHLKLLDAARNGVRRLVINAVECEPGIHCDAALCEEDEAGTINAGIRALARVLDAEVHIAQGNARFHADAGWTLHALDEPGTPDGHEISLARRLFGAALQPGQRPGHQGLVFFNVGTAHAVGRALSGWALTARMVTVACENRWLPVGLPLSALMPGPWRVGGRLSGAVEEGDAAISKTTNAVHPHQPRMALPCIHCARCDVACPEALPVADLVRAGLAEGAERCIECGLCNPVCPSDIDVLNVIRERKRSLTGKAAANAAADRAQARYESHKLRLEERAAARHAKRAERLKRVRGDA